MQVMLHVEPAVARSLRGAPEAAASGELLSRARDLGVTLRPLRFPTGGFAVEVPDRETAERVARKLGDCDAVEAAYYVPSAELP